MGLFNEKLSAGAIRYLTFGIPELDSVDWRDEESAVGQGFHFHPRLPRESLQFNIQFTTAEELRKEAFCRNRPLKEGVLEWARFDPYRVELFFSRLEKDPAFKDGLAGYYDALRCLYHRTTDQVPPVAPTLDVALIKKAEVLLENEMRLEEACKKEWMVRRGRVDYLLAAKKNGWLGQLIGLENDLPRLPKWTATWIPRYQPRLVPENSLAPAATSGEAVAQRKRPFKGDESVENQIAKRRRTARGEQCTRPCRTGKVRRSSSRTVRMIATPEKSLSPVKKDLVERARSRRRSITPFPADVPNRIIA